MFRDDRLDTSDIPAPAVFTFEVKDEVSDPTRRRAGPTEEAPADHDAGADTLADANRYEVRSPRVVMPRLRYHSQQHSTMSPPRLRLQYYIRMLSKYNTQVGTVKSMGYESLGMRTATPHTSGSLRGRSGAARELLW